MAKPIDYLGYSSKKIIKEANNLSLDVEMISENDNFFYIQGNGKKVLFKSTDFGVNSSLGYKIADNKKLTYQVLEKNKLPIAKSLYISSLDNIEKAISIKKIQFPVIIKPINEGHGNGVQMNILDIDELKEKLSPSLKRYGNMIIQEQIIGDEFRIIVFDNEILAAINRIPAHVIGDGKSTVQELIDQENENPLRGEGYNKSLAYIIIDDELKSFIQKKNYKLESIPREKELINLRGNSNIGTGGTSKDYTDDLCDDIKKVCIEATKRCGLVFCGIDVITTDITNPLAETGGIILELNATPGIGYPGRNIARSILEKIFD